MIFRIKRNKVHYTKFPPPGIPSLCISDMVGKCRIEYVYSNPKQVYAIVDADTWDAKGRFRWREDIETWHMEGPIH